MTGLRWVLAGALAAGLLAPQAAGAAQKHKIFLSMSYIGNDWQAEAANMVKAMAGHKSLADKVNLEVQVAGPNAQRQIQQINAMVQAGAQAIVVYPISPTALNAAVKNACDKGVMIIAYDSVITEPCAYNVTIDQEEAGRVTASHFTRGEGRLYIRVFPHKSVTSIPLETRMGKGKGEPEFWAAVIKPGMILFEIAGLPEAAARDCLARVAYKMPFKCRFVARRQA